MKHLHKPIFSLALASFLGLASCSQEEMLPDGNAIAKGEPFTLTLTLDRSNPATRTSLEENENAGMTSKWVAGDKIYLYNTNGEQAGILDLQEGSEGQSKGVFSGTCNGGTGKYSLFYYDADNTCFGHDSNDNAGYVLTFNNATHPYYSTPEELASMELLTIKDPDEYEMIEVAVKDGIGTVTKDIVLEAKLAMARFSLNNLPVGATGTLNIYDVDDAEGKTCTYAEYAKKNGKKHYSHKTEGGITISNVDASKDVFVAFVPETYTLGFKFTTSDNKVYVAEFANSTKLLPGVYYNAGLNGENDVQGSVVNFEAQTPDYDIVFMKYPEGTTENVEYDYSEDMSNPTSVQLPGNPDSNNNQEFLGWKKEGSSDEPSKGPWDMTAEDNTVITLYPVYKPATKADDGTVGPVIQINGRKYKFVRGNLYYDINDNSWHLYEKETYYRLLAGTSGIASGKSINGKSINKETNHIIDMFPWGATGLGESTSSGRAKTPDVIRQGWASEKSYSSTNWPSYNTATMDTKGNANIIDLWNSYTYNEPIYDFGYAYMQKGRPSDDNRNYVTPPLSAYAYICENSFSQGCKITGAGYDGKEAKGALILFGITDISDAVAAINKVGGKTGSDFCELNPNNQDSHFVYDITLPKYESLEDLNKLTEVNGKPVKIYAMFFAAGGNGSYNFSSNSVTLNDTDGAYWSSNASKGDANTANAYGLYFRNFKTGLEFCWETGASGVKSSRNTQRSVRLMVDVTDSEAGTVGPDYSK